MNNLNLVPIIEAETIEKNIDAFLDRISLRNRVIFIRRYWFCDTYADISVRYGIRESKVKRQIQRTQGQMSDYLNKTWGSYGINHVNTRFVREAEYVASLRQKKIYLHQCNSILIGFVEFLIRKLMCIPDQVYQADQ